MKKIFLSKRFWGAVVIGVGYILHTMGVPFGDQIITAGSALAAAGVVDKVKREKGVKKPH